MLYEEIVALIGEPPAGSEPLVYCLCMMFLVMLAMSAFYLLCSVIKWIGGR